MKIPLPSGGGWATRIFRYLNTAFLCVSVSLCFIFLCAGTNIYAANLSFDIGKDSSGISAGRDFRFGYALLGMSTKFVTDAPWSYVPTRQSLDSACQDFKSVNPKNCDPRGRFNDGDEW
ncbi:MAG: hypothetical protein PH343_06335, partial [Nitrospira sp.]|nr:hypothetical protein [Nitrospira sp.]